MAKIKGAKTSSGHCLTLTIQGHGGRWGAKAEKRKAVGFALEGTLSVRCGEIWPGKRAALTSPANFLHPRGKQGLGEGWENGRSILIPPQTRVPFLLFVFFLFFQLLSFAIK